MNIWNYEVYGLVRSDILIYEFLFSENNILWVSFYDVNDCCCRKAIIHHDEVIGDWFTYKNQKYVLR